MSYRQCLPHPGLRHLVKCYWHLQTTVARGERQTVLPDGCMELIVHFGAMPRTSGGASGSRHGPAAFVGGQITEALQLHANGNIGMVGVRLWPWSGAPLLGIAMHEIAGHSIALSDLPGLDAAGLPDQLAAAPDADTRLRIVDEFMRQLGSRAGAVNALAAAAIQRLDRARGALTVTTLAAGLAVSERHLNRTLRHHVGLAAKSYGRIRRFQACIGAVRRGELTTWTQAAHHAGYTDQAHFSHDLKKLCGVSPGTLLREHRLLVEPAE